MNALLRDAHNGKLVSIRKLFDLALAYEHKLAEASKQIPVKQSVPIAGAHASEAEHQSKRRRPEGNACERGDSDRATARNQTDTNRPTNDATAAPDSELVPTTARGRGRGRQSESGKEKSCARSRQRLHKHAFTILMTVVTLLGGQTAFTMFVVGMIRAAKELDKRRKPPIARFRTARLEGVTIAAIDKLRFSSIWDENDDELDEEAEAEMRDARPDGGTDRRRETTATDLDRQGKALLRAQYPSPPAVELVSKAAANTPASGAFAGVEPDGGCTFLAAKSKELLRAASQLADAKPLGSGIWFWKSAAFDVAGANLDYVGRSPTTTKQSTTLMKTTRQRK
mmetsp:Transcript_16347/g.39182  ORF Transcript_16347/g.39182 Transcript_16347/m.39182 type:complete len:340 (-) Transcript_16347:852-1871(-)